MSDLKPDLVANMLEHVAFHSSFVRRATSTAGNLQRGCTQVAAAVLTLAATGAPFLTTALKGTGLQRYTAAEALLLDSLMPVCEQLTSDASVFSMRNSVQLTWSGMSLITVGHHADAAALVLADHATLRLQSLLPQGGRPPASAAEVAAITAALEVGKHAAENSLGFIDSMTCISTGVVRSSAFLCLLCCRRQRSRCCGA